MTTFVRLLAALLLLIFLSAESKANTVTKDDSDKLALLSRDVSKLSDDFMAGMNAFLLEKPNAFVHRASCADPISQNLNNVLYRLTNVRVLVSLSSDMRDQMDEMSVNSFLETTLDFLKMDLISLQKEASEASGKCSESAFINTRAQSLGAFVEKTTSIVEKLQTKLKEHPPSDAELRAYLEKTINYPNDRNRNSSKP